MTNPVTDDQHMMKADPSDEPGSANAPDDRLTPAVHPLVSRLIALEPLKTWSLIVTLFGDLKGEVLTGSDVRLLLGQLGVKPETIRVALHRLKTDGWIAASKVGREAQYRLSERGRKETEAVRADIYSQTVRFPEGWEIHVLRHAEPPDGAVPITSDVFALPVVMAPMAHGSLRLSFSEADLPDWVEDALVPPTLLTIATELAHVIQDAKQVEGVLTARDETCLRIMVLHHWRRLALRRGTWAHIAFCPHGSVARCHRAVTGFLSEGKQITP